MRDRKKAKSGVKSREYASRVQYEQEPSEADMSNEVDLYLSLLQDPAVLLQPQHVPLLLECPATHGQYHLEPFAALGSILLEPLAGSLLNAVLDLLPSSTQCGYLGALLEVRPGGWRCSGRLVDAGFADVEEVGPGHVH